MFKLIIALMFLCVTSYAKITPVSRDIAAAQSMGASFNSLGAYVGEVDLISIQAVWSGGGSPTGDFIVEVSNDDVAITTPDQAGNVVNWTTYLGSTISITTDGSMVYNIANLGYKWARLKYTRTSGTGTFNANLVVKVK